MLKETLNTAVDLANQMEGHVKALESRQEVLERMVHAAVEELRNAQAAFECGTHKRFCAKCPIVRAVEAARKILGGSSAVRRTAGGGQSEAAR